MIDWSKYPTPDKMRHHVAPNNYFPKQELKIEPVNYPPLYEKVDWKEHFQNGEPPQYLDIGCGFGWFSMDFSTLIDENLLGIEVRRRAVDYAKKVKATEELDNCSFLWYSVVNGLHFIEENSIKKVFYFFPDPWFKKKHHKRRAFDVKFLENCYRVIENGGELRLQTDILEVHEYHLENLAEFGKFDYKVIDDNSKWDLPATNKEKDCIKNGYEYYRIIATKNV
ncbi:MAG: tRNA (guanosine(46)-N7)-methyltransferase TrmB [Chlorobiota bacterium]